MLAQQVDGTLTDAEATMLRDHLAICADCRRLEQELLQINQDLFLLSVEPPASLEEGIMAKIRAEAPPTAPIGTFATSKATYRRWFSTAAAFFLVITATIIGSRILPLEHEGSTDPGTMSSAQNDAAVPLEGSEIEVGTIQSPSPKIAPGAEAPAAAHTAALPEGTPSASTKRSAAPDASVVAGDYSGSPSSTDNSARAIADMEGDSSASSDPAYDGLANAFAPDSLLPPPPPQEDVYTAGGSPESAANSSDSSGLPAGQLLDAEAAELLLLEYLALPPASLVTVTYEGLTPQEEAHLFLVTRPENKKETYSVNRTQGTVTLLPASDPASSLAP